MCQGSTCRPPFSPLASGPWAELCRCSPAPVARQGLNRRPHFTEALSPELPLPWGRYMVPPMPYSLPQGLVRSGSRSTYLSLALRLSNRWTNHSVKALSPELPLPWGRYMGSAHAIFAPPGFGTLRESIHRSLACASAFQPLDQPFRQSSIPRATSPLGEVHGLSPCRIRSPRVWYAPGIDLLISRLCFGLPTAGPTIPSKLYPQSYLSPGGGTWAQPMPYSLPQGLVRPDRALTEWLVQRLDSRSASERSVDRFPGRTKPWGTEYGMG